MLGPAGPVTFLAASRREVPLISWSPIHAALLNTPAGSSSPNRPPQAYRLKVSALSRPGPAAGFRRLRRDPGVVRTGGVERNPQPNVIGGMAYLDRTRSSGKTRYARQAHAWDRTGR